MKTLILISHPQFEDSGTQQFLKTSFYSLDDVKYQVIDELYTATGTIDIEKEQNALRDFDRIVFQFPMYWYSSPASLKRFMDDVFTRNYIVAKRSLKTKELGIVVSLGDAEADFQAGGPEQFTVSELLRPFQAFANKAGMTYLKPFVVNQFGYLDPAQKEKLLVDYLNDKGMHAYSLTIKPVHTVRKAIIPVAGYGTRLYPATRCMKKDFFPIPCPDGMVRPVILILLEELMQSGIEEVCIVLGSEDERQQYKNFFERPLGAEHFAKLNAESQEYENRILNIGKHLHYVIQKEKRGFGHAVYQAASFAKGEPVLLMLGDTLYRSLTNKPCALQLIEAYERYNKLLLGLYSVPLSTVSHFGIMSGVWEDKDERVMHVKMLVEKPTANYSEEFLGVRNKQGEKEYCSVFGQYILTPEVFQQLAADIAAADAAGNMTKEIELTSALDAVRLRTGMIGLRLKGERFDMGNTHALVETVSEFSKPVK